MTNSAKLRIPTVGTFYSNLVFLFVIYQWFFFAPFNSGWSTNVKILASYTATLVFLNSSLNPLIYCRKMRHIRHTVMEILKTIVPSHDHK